MKNYAGTFAIAVEECSSEQIREVSRLVSSGLRILAISNKGYFFMWRKKRQKLTDQTVFC